MVSISDLALQETELAKTRTAFERFGAEHRTVEEPLSSQTDINLARLIAVV